MKRHFKKLTAFVLVAAMLAAFLPAFVFGASAQSQYTKEVDPSTMDSWQQLFPSNDTTQAGRIWTDKTVLADAQEFANLKDAIGEDAAIELLSEDNFLVVLSALASNKSIVGYSYTPTDTMLILDASASMGNSNYVEQLVDSANDAIVELLKLNKHNRVGVVLYSGVQGDPGNSAGSTAQVLLPLGRYTHSQNEFLETNNNESYIRVNANVKNSAGIDADENSKNVSGGTYIQNGIYMAMEELLDADTVIPDGQIQAGATRTPIFVLMSDGAATAATNNISGANLSANQVGIGTSNLGDGTDPENVLDDVIDFATQLTAAYAKAKVKAHYNNTEPYFYTLGLGANNSVLNSAVLNPSGFTNTDEYWEDYVALSNNSTLILEIEERRQNQGGPGNNNNNNVDTTSFTKIAQITDVAQKNYATDYFPATNAEDLEKAFADIVKQIIIQSLYYPTLVESGNHDHDGFVEFIDEIGHYMDVKDIKGILIGDTLFTGKHLAENFVESGGKLIENGKYTEMGNNVVWSVMERIGIDSVEDARDLINSAYDTGQLRYFDQGDNDPANDTWSNFIGWYADDNGNYLGHWHEGHTDEDIPTGATYINRSYGMLGEISGDYAETDLMYISTQVHTRILDGNVSFIWRIPASLIPIVSYNVTLNAETIAEATDATIEYKAEDPIRIVFEVGLIDEINKANVSEIIADPESHIIDENKDGVSDDGKYYFHTNWWKDANTTHEHFSYTHDTVVFFEPSLENERYYYTETTPVLIKDGENYVRYTGTKPGENDSNTYYRQYYVFKDGAQKIVSLYEPMSDATLAQATPAENNAWNIPAGVVHRVLEPYNLEKDPNVTGSIKYVRYPVVEEIPGDQGHFYVGSLLGNNGRLSMNIPQGIKLTKTVDDTLYGTDKTFTFQILADAAISGDFELYVKKADGTWKTPDTITFANGNASAMLAAGETAYILGIDENVEYTITEVAGQGYAVSDIKINGTSQTDISQAKVTVANDDMQEVEFTNTLVVNDATIVVSKEVTHDPALTYNNNLEFTFRLYRTDNPATYTEFTLKAGESRTFTAADGILPGNYTIEEVSILPGFTAVDNKISKDVANGSASAYAFHFVNNYQPAPVKPVNVIVSGTKTLNGRTWQAGDEFAFALQYHRADGWETLATKKVEYNVTGNYDYSFDFASDELKDFELDTLGTHFFRVVEVVPANALGGVTYDDVVKYFDVIVTDKTMDGKLEIDQVTANAPATVVLDGATWGVDADFTNVYAANQGDQITINIEKTVDNTKADTQISPEGFVFGLYTQTGETPLVTSQPTDANGNTSITLTFPASSAGRVYNFVLKEIKPDDALKGMTYAADRDITITVVDNFDGTVTAKIGALETSTEDVTNVYAPDDVAVTLDGKKVLEGRDFKANDFEFVLADKEGYSNNGDDLTSPKTVGHASKTDGGGINFGTINFTKVGTYRYTISEVIPAENQRLGGVDYSTKVYDVEIIVSDDADNDGDLDAVVKVDGTQITGSTANTIVFVNTYEAAEAEVTLEATKNLIGRDINADDNFKFDLYSANSEFLKGNVVYNDVKLVIDTQNAKKGLIKFEEMTFGTEGDWYFVAVEDGENGKGITVDKTEYKIHINVKDNTEGKFVATVKVDGTTVTGSTKDAIVFNNEYEATASLTIAATKKLDGREIKPDEFTFELYDEQNQKIGETKVKEGGKIEFEPIMFVQTGDKTYNYTIKEFVGSDSAISYDTKTYALKVETTDNGDGTLTIKTYVDTKLVTGSTKDEIVFNNTYSTSGILVIKAEKDLVGRDLVADEFEFELYDELGAKVETVKNDADGKVSFTAIQLDKAGKKVYTIKEVKGNQENVIYDDAVYTIEVTAKDNGDGTLTVTQKFFDANDDEITKIIFENTYKEPIKPPATGDTVNPLLLALVIISVVGLAVVVRNKKQNA